MSRPPLGPWLGISTAALLLAACADAGDPPPDDPPGTSSSSSSSGGSGATGAGVGAGGAGGAGVEPPAGGEGAGGGPVDLSTFTSDVAEAVCGLLFRCCDGADHEEYFAQYAANSALEAFVDQIPPRHPFADEAECAATLGQMLEVTPWRDWIDAAESSEVTLVESELESCRAALTDAACGIEATQALFDSTCFGFAPPGGGSQQRRMFARTRGPGDECRPIRDGLGGTFYGSCDPHSAFCCYVDNENPSEGCTLPFASDGSPREGVCAATAASGEECSVTPPLELCETGLYCSGATSVCLADDEQPLVVGELCMDEAYNLLGECVASFCDVLGSALCEPLKPEGAQCYSGYECQSDACIDQACAPPTFCTAP